MLKWMILLRKFVFENLCIIYIPNKNDHWLWSAIWTYKIELKVSKNVYTTTYLKGYVYCIHRYYLFYNYTHHGGYNNENRTGGKFF